MGRSGATWTPQASSFVWIHFFRQEIVEGGVQPLYSGTGAVSHLRQSLKPRRSEFKSSNLRLLRHTRPVPLGHPRPVQIEKEAAARAEEL